MRNLFKAGLRRLSAPAPAPTSRHATGFRQAAVIAVATRKGGVGKTTTSVSLAAALARLHDKKVLLVDLDPQGHVSTALRAQVRLGGMPLSRVLLDDQGGEVLDAVAPTGIPNLHVTAFDPQLAQTEDLLGTRIGKEFILRDALRVTRTHYDYIVVDCPPNLGNLALNGLVAADRVLIPCDPSPLAVKGVDSLVETVTTISQRLNPDIDVLGILLTRVDGRNTTVNEAVVGEIESIYGPALLPVRISTSTSLSKAQMEGKDIFEFEPEGRAAEQYRALADLVLQATTEPTPG
jgi:chromosome partitioning protein